MRTDSDQADKDYTRGTEEILRCLIEHYDKTLRHLPTSPLNDWIQARLDDVYIPPCMLLMEKYKGSFKKTNTHVTEYKAVLNNQTFIQGEAGSGKTSFLAKLVMDWCSITKTQQTSEPLMAKETHYAAPETRTRNSTFFDDLTTLKGYQFVFYITLRNSVKQLEVLEMIKEQIIDEIYSSKEDRERAYRLVNDIIKNERCLVLLDGLDEWKRPGDRQHLPTLVAIYTQCDLVITTRPWKLAEAKIPDSKIKTLLLLEGVHEPFDVSLRILRCRNDCTNSNGVDNKHSEFEAYVLRNNLRDLLASPMLITLIVQTWAEGTELKGKRCQIYSILLESLFKKANSEEDHFYETPFQCFKGTQYIKPNIEHLNRFSEAAFHLLFSEERENYLVFGIEQLKQYKLNERKDFAMRAGILSAARKASTLRSSSSFSFVHKSVQEFLAAYYIACYSHVIDEVISVYLINHENSYLDISEVLIFLCGLDISAANKLSILMNKAACECLVSLERFQDIILKGYMEAVANEYDDVRLELSHFFIDSQNIKDLHNIWARNIPTVRCVTLELEDDCIDCYTELESECIKNYTKLESDYIESDTELEDDCIERKTELERDCIEIPTEVEDDCTESPTQDMQSSIASSKIASRIEFDLTSCDKLKEIYINGESFEVLIKDSISLNASTFPNWIVLHCEDSSPVLSCLTRIELKRVTVCSTWMQKLFNTQLTLDHEVNFKLHECIIIPSVGDELSPFSDASITTCVNNTFDICDLSGECPGLWETLFDLNIKTLSLFTDSMWRVNYTSSLSQSLLSLKQLETLSIHVDAIPHDLWSVLYSLSLKRVAVSLSGEFKGLIIGHADMLSQLNFPAHVFDSIYIDVTSHPDLLAAMHGLNITSLSLFCSGESLTANQTALLLTMLKSLKKLYQVSIDVKNDSRGLWEALHGIHIQCLNIGLQCRCFKVNHVASLLTSLSSLEQLEMIRLYVINDIDVVSEILHSLKIKSLSLVQKSSIYFGRLDCSFIFHAPNSLNERSIIITLYFDFDKLEVTLQSLFQLFSSLEVLCFMEVFPVS
ncbi:uncharacterized protein LOC127859814 [Dreissena polymorpha]|uniref:NACHT domain-containing protein n=1 Tax=Dreissena polymorpha TaxID=45954 RepID=A0A9D3YUF4_DREPO|nr:uncharacterized protein LOC127859814 [Dreissena polymorpha]KAH3705668.1 hypothetical protein DPMN_080745 [Dreissena polymorpha]